MPPPSTKFRHAHEYKVTMRLQVYTVNNVTMGSRMTVHMCVCVYVCVSRVTVCDSIKTIRVYKKAKPLLCRQRTLIRICVI